MKEINRRDLAKTLTFAAVGSALHDESNASEHQPKPDNGFLRFQECSPGIWKATIGRPERHTPVRTRLIPPAVTALGKLPKPSRPELSIQGRVGERGTFLQLPLKPHEAIFGFGLQLLSMQNRGKRRVTRVNADPKMDTGDSHAPVPFYVSSEGYGIFVDTARNAEFFVGNARKKPQKAIELHSSAVVDPQYSHNLGDQDPGTVSVEVPTAKGVDVYLFAGPTLLQAVQRYNLFSGGGCVPPEWGLGFWYRGDGKSNQDQIIRLATEFRARNIPCDVLGLEPGWQSHAYSCTYVWDDSRFPAPDQMMQQLVANKFKVNLWEHAFTNPASPIFPSLVSHSGDYGVWGGLVPDFQDPTARGIFGDYHGRKLVDLGVAGFKLDECDGSDYTGGWSFPNFSRFPSGIDGEQMHALFGLRYQHTINEQFTKRGKSTYGLVRSSGALASPYPFVLYSDLYEHRQFVRGLVTSGFSGLLWCPEVRDAKSEEDLIRRLQSVVFSPLAMINGWYIKNPPWKQIDRKMNNCDQLNENWESLESQCREIIGWRMQLIPYLTGAFEKYASEGLPVFRALAMDYSAPSLRNIDDQYMMGDRLMVAPLFAGEDRRQVVIPEGEWQDFWTGKRILGNTTLVVPANTKNIPVYIKADSILPIATVTQCTEDAQSRALEIRVYGNGSTPWSNSKGAIQWDAATGEPLLTGGNYYSRKSWRRF